MKNIFKSFGSAGFVLAACFVIALVIYHYVLGNPANFLNNDPNNQPVPGNLMGTIYKGGVIVPVIQTLLLTVLVLSVERLIAIRRAKGKGNLPRFIRQIKECLKRGQIGEAEALCDRQRGAVANVIRTSLQKYAQMEADDSLTKEQKMMGIQAEVEQATALELPMLEQNLPVVATMTTLGTLMGLLGTVLGMIKSFAALANAGAPDSIALSTGISEALVNTAFGIATGALAVVSYNFFTSKIDAITYSIDEIGFTIVQTFSVTHK